MDGRIVITGNARHGKDSVAEHLRDSLGLTFESSSMFCARAFIFDAIKDTLGYSTLEECFEDRVNHRALWASMIRAYNHDDPARLSRDILSKYDVYVGIRSDRELAAAKEEGLVKIVVWVDASRRLPLEPADSFDIGVEMADIVIDNNGTEEQLVQRLGNLVSLFSHKNGTRNARTDRLCTK
jgi:hypothetical protein